MLKNDLGEGVPQTRRQIQRSDQDAQLGTLRAGPFPLAAEQARLQAEVDRAQHVVDAIDAAQADPGQAGPAESE